MTLTLQQYCANHRLTAKKFHAKLEYIGLHVTEHSVSCWVRGKNKPIKQYWAAIYKATDGEVDISGTPSIKSMEALLLENGQSLVKDLMRIEGKIDEILRRMG